MFHFFMRLTQEKNCPHGSVSFFNEVDTVKELSSLEHASFFNEVEKGKEPSSWNLFIASN